MNVNASCSTCMPIYLFLAIIPCALAFSCCSCAQVCPDLLALVLVLTSFSCTGCVFLYHLQAGSPCIVFILWYCCMASCNISVVLCGSLCNCKWRNGLVTSHKPAFCGSEWWNICVIQGLVIHVLQAFVSSGACPAKSCHWKELQVYVYLRYFCVL